MKKLIYLVSIIVTTFSLISCQKDMSISNTKVPIHVQEYNRNADHAIKSTDEFMNFRLHHVYPFDLITENSYQTLLYSMNFNTTGNFFSFSNTGNLFEELNDEQLLEFFTKCYGVNLSIEFEDGRVITNNSVNSKIESGPILFPYHGYNQSETGGCKTCCVTAPKGTCWINI